MAHADWLLRGPEKSVLPCKVWREHFQVVLNENKKGLGIMFVGKVRTITRPGTLVLLFLKAVHL